jgi:hypothetical protein
MKAAGKLPDFGRPDYTYEAKGPDGRTIVALFFGGAGA